jgi:D-alanyl-lipoteichoic acid acyltransferase DltB (MBOAT superfamily)
LRYASFAVDPLLHLLNLDIQVSKLSDIIVPIGISYFTLQGIGYIINIKMGWEKPERKFLDFLLYITFFPKFLSGPIERSNHFLQQLKTNLSFNENQIAIGLRIALLGFFKKVAIADQMAPFVNGSFANLDTADGFTIWILLIILPVYLYFDFSGYTDIAIGIAKAFGINLLPNFNRPFFSENVTLFWKRFHISLASWFGDYIFRQIVFKRRKWKIYSSIYAVLITWTLFGIWHGAGWNFMFLGLMQAIAINYEFVTKKWRSRFFSKYPESFRIWLGRILTYLFYGVSLVFFFSPDLQSAFTVFSKLFEFSQLHITLSRREAILFIVSIIYVLLFLYIEFLYTDRKTTYDKLVAYWSDPGKKRRLTRWTFYYLLLVVIFITGGGEQEFVYFQF